MKHRCILLHGTIMSELRSTYSGTVSYSGFMIKFMRKFTRNVNKTNFFLRKQLTLGLIKPSSLCLIEF